MRSDAQKPRRHIAWIVTWLGCAAAIALGVAPVANAQQGAAQDQYKLHGLKATGSDRGQGGAPPAPTDSSQINANSLAATGGADPGVVVWVLVIGLAAVSCLGGLIAYRRRPPAGALAPDSGAESDDVTLEVDGRRVYVRLQPTGADPVLTIQPLNCNLEGEGPGSHQTQ
jgi:hypothetical protein